MTAIEIDGRALGPERPPFIVAEIGMNHNGDLQLGKEMIQSAAEAGADAVKFQSFQTDQFLSEAIKNREQYREYELSRQDHESLISEARHNNITFFSTPFDKVSVDLLDELDVPCFKIASADITNLPLIKDIAERQKPVLLSTGYSTMSEVATAVERIRDVGGAQLILLHCVSLYPTQPRELNLKVIRTLRRAFQIDIALSDHTQFSPVAPVAATALGASVIEKHFTTNNDLPGFDHEISENPDSFSEMVELVRTTFEALGTGWKQPLRDEIEKRDGARRSTFWRDSYPSEMTIKDDMLVYKRPGGGVPPIQVHELVGRDLSMAVEAGDRVDYGQIDWDS